ncbi:MAG: phytanoyl-CoA dioxygenase family protein [Actinomycetota bacterium]
MRQVIRNFAKDGRQIEPIWRYGFNFLPSLQYKLKPSANSGDATLKIVERLNQDGIAITSIDELLADKTPFAELESAIESLLSSRHKELQEIKLNAGDAAAIGEKTFNVELLGSEVEFDADSVFARFALQETFLNIANAYFGMLVKLRYYNVWQTFMTSGTARESQLWHFDREDNCILKLFLYLKDVDEGAGPFTYAPKTHRKGKLWEKQPEFSLEKNVMRSTDEQMAAVVPKESWVQGVGKKGTIIFADTRGFHKGGEARTDDRLMFTAMFTSPASDSKRLLRFPANLTFNSLTKKQLCALEIK